MTDINAIIASAIPVIPPDNWFENPGLDRPTAIRVAPDGRVFGHVASWNTNHIGMPHGVRPPKSRSNYAYFKTGEIQTASGQLLPVGQLTLSGGHASLDKTASQAARHYDDTKSAIADVTVGEDSHGIWVAGAVRPDATPEQIRALRASAPSGDWRLINGRLEMVAVCQVNVPGFPIPRALAASGHRVSLVAAGSLPLLAQVLAQQEFEARLQRLELLHAQREDEQLALAASAAKQRVHTVREAALSEVAEMARLRVRDPEKFRQLTAAGTFKYLPPGFLQNKASRQVRDGNGRFLSRGAIVRWRDGGGTYQYGQIVNGAINADGYLAVKLADADKTVQMMPKSVEKIKAVLPAAQVDNHDDRGVVFKKGEDNAVAASGEFGINDEDLANQGYQPGDQVGLVDGSGPVGVVIDVSDPGAIEVQDQDGLTSVYGMDELMPLPDADATDPDGFGEESDFYGTGTDEDDLDAVNTPDDGVIRIS